MDETQRWRTDKMDGLAIDLADFIEVDVPNMEGCQQPAARESSPQPIVYTSSRIYIECENV